MGGFFKDMKDAVIRFVDANTACPVLKQLNHVKFHVVGVPAQGAIIDIQHLTSAA